MRVVQNTNEDCADKKTCLARTSEEEAGATPSPRACAVPRSARPFVEYEEKQEQAGLEGILADQLDANLTISFPRTACSTVHRVCLVVQLVEGYVLEKRARMSRPGGTGSND